MIIVCIRCFIDSTYLSPNVSVKPVGWAPFSSWENGDCKNALAVLGHPAPKCWGHWRWDPGSLGSLSRLTASLLCHSAGFTTPNCPMRKCNKREDSGGDLRLGVWFLAGHWWELHECLWRKAFLLLTLLFLMRWDVCMMLESKPHTERQNIVCFRPKIWRADEWDLEVCASVKKCPRMGSQQEMSLALKELALTGQIECWQ